MSEMIEKVARAIDAADGLQIWDQCDEVIRNSYRRDARAALAAMREPTEVMAEYGSTWAWDYSPDHARRVFKAMIDAALK